MSAQREFTSNLKVEHVIAAYVDTARGALGRASARAEEIDSEEARVLVVDTVEAVRRTLVLVSELLRTKLAADRDQHG